MRPPGRCSTVEASRWRFALSWTSASAPESASCGDESAVGWRPKPLIVKTAMRPTPSVPAIPCRYSFVTSVCENGSRSEAGLPASTLARSEAIRDCSRLCCSDGSTSAASTTSTNAAEAAATTVSRMRRRPGRCSAVRIMRRSGTRRRAPSGSAPAPTDRARASRADGGCARRSCAARGSRPSPTRSRAAGGGRARGPASA